jgi:hypothetical protein
MSNEMTFEAVDSGEPPIDTERNTMFIVSIAVAIQLNNQYCIVLKDEQGMVSSTTTPDVRFFDNKTLTKFNA